MVRKFLISAPITCFVLLNFRVGTTSWNSNSNLNPTIWARIFHSSLPFCCLPHLVLPFGGNAKQVFNTHSEISAGKSRAIPLCFFFAPFGGACGYGAHLLGNRL